MGQPDKQIEFERKYSRLPEAVIAMQERDFLRYNFRTNVAISGDGPRAFSTRLGQKGVRPRRWTVSSTVICSQGIGSDPGGTVDLVMSEQTPSAETRLSAVSKPGDAAQTCVRRVAIRDISGGDSGALGDL